MHFTCKFKSGHVEFNDRFEVRVGLPILHIFDIKNIKEFKTVFWSAQMVSASEIKMKVTLLSFLPAVPRSHV